MSCPCNTKIGYAYVVDKIGDPKENKIYIQNYINNKDLQNEVSNGNKYLVCSHDLILSKYESNIRKSHFFHKNNINMGMSEWHKNWQSYFEKKEIKIDDHIADVIENNFIIEFQYSKILKENVISRNNNAKNNKYEIIWVIECSESIEVTKLSSNVVDIIKNGDYINDNINDIAIEQKDTDNNLKTESESEKDLTNDHYDIDNYFIEFTDENWKYENFMDCDYIYLDHNNIIYRINPKNIRGKMIDVLGCKTKEQFIHSLKNNTNIWPTEITKQCNLYYNQRGAGCGKTYESIQLINDVDLFQQKNIFIYLTKMHSAREVIYNEFREQYERNSLQNITEVKEKNTAKQYYITYKNTKYDTNNDMIIATIDSLMFALKPKGFSSYSKDYFREIVKSVEFNKIDSKIKMAGKDVYLDKKCLIIIDEAQDLDPIYIYAIYNIILNVNADVYIIGDKLQSIWSENNIFTFLEKNDLPKINLIKSIGKNHVMRFHNKLFKNMINDVVDFKKYDLEPIQDICNIKCNYLHEDEITPLELIHQCVSDVAKKEDVSEMENFLESQIKSKLDEHVTKYNYLPKNFMFIFTILKSNILANRLETFLQNYWINKFNDVNYKNFIMNSTDKKYDYYKNLIINNEYTQHVYLHRSDEGKSINLKESENATRILSIHSSKGNGCEVVFLLDFNEMKLKRFTNNEINLQYESLFHVALTRQKKHLYICSKQINKENKINGKGDNIINRFKNNNYIETCSIYTEKHNCNMFRISNIIDYALDINGDSNIIQKIFSDKDYQKLYLIEEKEQNKKIIDMGHHIIRKYSILYYFLFNLHKDTDNDTNQIYRILEDIKNCTVNKYNGNVYYQHLYHLYDINNNCKCKCEDSICIDLLLCKTCCKNTIPILSYDDNNKNIYLNILEKIIKNIQNKIKKENCKKLPPLCFIETIIFGYIMQIRMNGAYTEITISDIYNILYYYDSTIHTINIIKHSKKITNKCLCSELFTKKHKLTIPNMDIKNSIMDHYKKIKKINNIYKIYKEEIYKYTNYKLSFNFLHHLRIRDEDGDKKHPIKISHKTDIIGYNKEICVNFIISPIFDKLNIYKKLTECIFTNWITKHNTKKSDKDKFLNKKCICCIITLSNDKPIIIDMELDKWDVVLSDYVYDMIKKYYNPYINNVIKYFKQKTDEFESNNDKYEYIKGFCKNNNIDKKKNFFYKIFANLNENLDKHYNKRNKKITDITKFNQIIEEFDIDHVNKWLDNILCDLLY